MSPEQREEARARGRAAVAQNREEKRVRATERTISELERDSARTKVENVMAQQRAIGQRSSAAGLGLGQQIGKFCRILQV